MSARPALRIAVQSVADTEARVAWIISYPDLTSITAAPFTDMSELFITDTKRQLDPCSIDGTFQFKQNILAFTYEIGPISQNLCSLYDQIIPNITVTHTHLNTQQHSNLAALIIELEGHLWEYHDKVIDIQDNLMFFERRKMISRILLSAVLGFAVLVYLLTPVFYSGTVPDVHLDALRELVALFIGLPSFLALKASIEEQERTLLFHANFLESSFEDIRGWFDFLDFLQTLNHGGQFTRENFRLSINFKKKAGDNGSAEAYNSPFCSLSPHSGALRRIGHSYRLTDTAPQPETHARPDSLIRPVRFEDRSFSPLCNITCT